MPAGYSGTPLLQKLGIKPGHRLLFVQPPNDFAATFGALPDDTELVKPTAKQIDVILLFVKSLRRSQEAIRAAIEAISR